ncbi:V-type proton ATPase subunit G 1 isoform X1 [Hemicordylus capensis]|uniref:V-type proton ATPase subunit G 1 isoform X1 n=1 Tax=Hemicordylus capensis TaxID=884348 RepID=UPI00230390E9|nr:V-type proton ATPase subunit G 1 isoform X1 [Hemicordylus capensis]
MGRRHPKDKEVKKNLRYFSTLLEKFLGVPWHGSTRIKPQNKPKKQAGRKNRRLKQAKEEAQAEIEQYRFQREKDFKEKEAAALGSHGSSTTEVEKETQEKMVILQNHFQTNREEVINRLLNFVCEIKPEINLNYRING